MRLENMLDINHELIKLSKHIDWESLNKEWGALFVSTKGAPAIRTRLIAGLHYLKHLHDLSGNVGELWVLNLQIFGKISLITLQISRPK